MGSLRLESGLPRVLWSPAAWWRYLLVSAVALVLAPWCLTSHGEHAALNVALGYASALMCFWRYRSGRGVPAAWLWIGAGLALNASGTIAEAIEVQARGSVPMPSPADALYLALYPLVTVGLLKIVRARYPAMGIAKLIDASALTVGLGLLLWIFVIRPTAASASGSVLAQVVDLAYPLGDLMLLAILSGVLVAEGWRTPPLLMMCLALVAFLAADAAWAVINNNNWSTTATVNAILEDPYLLACALFGAAALHVSTSTLDLPGADSGERTSRLLLAWVVLAGLVAPVTLAGETLTGRVSDGIAIAISSALLTGLVILRMFYLLGHVQRQSARLRDLALEDELTGLPNRRALQHYLADAMRCARRDEHPLSLAMLDLDHFKHFNDMHGHLAGDLLLKSMAAAWTLQLRGSDMLARVGGEEFVLVLPGADINEADLIVNKLRDGGPSGPTFSAGLAQWDGEALADELLGSADAAMYSAKRAGRDRIQRATPASKTG